MSENTEDPKDLLQLFIDFATEKGIKVDCPACSSQQGWSVYTSDKKGSARHNVLPTGDKGDIYIGKGSDVLAMACNHCGFLRLFELDAIEKWDKKRSTETGES